MTSARLNITCTCTCKTPQDYTNKKMLSLSLHAYMKQLMNQSQWFVKQQKKL